MHSGLSAAHLAAVLVVLTLSGVPVYAQPEQAGSVAVVDGTVGVTAEDGTTRNLHDGDPVYAGDTLDTGDGGYVDLELDDEGRILLQPNTRFQIAHFHFDPAAHGLAEAGSGPQDSSSAETTQESAVFHLFKGALRAIDGLIGKSNPQQYAMQTPVATIGIRGTEYDVRYCADNCASGSDQQTATSNGLYAAVTSGAIGIQTATGTSVLKQGGYGFLANRRARFRYLKTLPAVLRHMSLPERLKSRAERMRRLIRKRRLQRWKTLQRRRLRRYHRRRFGSNALTLPAGVAGGRV